MDFKNPNSDKSKWIDKDQLTALYMEFIKEFPVVSIEDPFDQDHWDAWTSMTAATPIQASVLLVIKKSSWVDRSTILLPSLLPLNSEVISPPRWLRW